MPGGSATSAGSHSSRAMAQKRTLDVSARRRLEGGGAWGRGHGLGRAAVQCHLQGPAVRAHACRGTGCLLSLGRARQAAT